ncbi:MAG TPA: 50S ribosomal protein L15 [Ktedonobacterales bacterium]|jgi:large subunit ribosomal protein L15
MRLSDLQAAPGARKEKRRLGRGHGSGRMKTAGRGTKGQKARTGGSVPSWFEGGQLRLSRRLPFIKGFTNHSKKEYAVINVAQLQVFEPSSQVDAEALVASGIIKASAAKGLIKILGDGDLDRPLNVRAHKFSASARAKIEGAGGAVEEIVINAPAKTKRAKKPTAQA